MKQNRLIFSLPFVSLMTLSFFLSVGYCWSQPSVKSPDEQARDMLSSADRIKVQVSTVGYPNGDEVDTFITDLKPTELKSVVAGLKLGAKRDKFTWGTSVTPILTLQFFEKEKKKGTLSIGYGYYAFDYFMAPASSDFPSRRLDVTVVRQLRHIIARNKKIVKALRDAGCSTKAIDPNRIPPVEKTPK